MVRASSLKAPRLAFDDRHPLTRSYDSRKITLKSLSWWTFRIFFIFLSGRGWGKGGDVRADGLGVGFYWKLEGGVGVRGGGGGGVGGRRWEHVWGRGAEYFFSGRNARQVVFLQISRVPF